MPVKRRRPGDPELHAIEDALTAIVRQSKSQPSMYPILRRIAEASPRLTELAELLSLDLSVISRHVRNLEARGLVARSADPDDRRAATLSLTNAGKEELKEFRAARQRRLAEVLDGWSHADRARFAILLSRFAEDLGA